MQTSCSPRENLCVHMESKPTALRKTPMTSRFKSPNYRINVENWVTKTTHSNKHNSGEFEKCAFD